MEEMVKISENWRLKLAEVCNRHIDDPRPNVIYTPDEENWRVCPSTRVVQARIGQKFRVRDWHTVGVFSDDKRTFTVFTHNATCDGCNANGVYYGRGMVENNKFKGFTGTCFRCGGKGYQSPEDLKRNTDYDNNYRRLRS